MFGFQPAALVLLAIAMMSTKRNYGEKISGFSLLYSLAILVLGIHVISLTHDRRISFICISLALFGLPLVGVFVGHYFWIRRQRIRRGSYNNW